MTVFASGSRCRRSSTTPRSRSRVARVAEAAELDGVFVYDHLWRGDPPEPPARARMLRAVGRGRGGDGALPRSARSSRAPRCGRPRRWRTRSRPRSASAAGGCSRRSAPATRRAGPRTRRSGSTSARWPNGSRRCTTPCARARARAIPVWVGGRGAAGPRDRRASPTAGTRGAPDPTCSRAKPRSCASRARRDVHVGRSRASARGRRGGVGGPVAALRRRRRELDHRRARRFAATPPTRPSSARCARRSAAR